MQKASALIKFCLFLKRLAAKEPTEVPVELIIALIAFGNYREARTTMDNKYTEEKQKPFGFLLLIDAVLYELMNDSGNAINTYERR